MATLYLSDLINRAAKENPGLNLDLKKIKLIRHALSHKRFKTCYDKGFFEEYQKLQNEGFFKGHEYVMSFVSGPGTSAKFLGMFRVVDPKGIRAQQATIPDGFPMEEMFQEGFYYNMEPSAVMGELIGRLLIDWGKGTRKWDQSALNEKEVLAIQENPKYTFSGFENLVLDYMRLKEIIDDPTRYETWHTALSSVYAIYLIVDGKTGKQYVGSAYGKDGLLGRWRQYVDTHHGNNKRMVELLQQHPDRYKSFQFSILQIIPKSSADHDATELERLYKTKLMSVRYGLNEN